MKTRMFTLLLAVWALAACAPQEPETTAFPMPTLARIATNTPAFVGEVATPQPEETELAIATAPGSETPTGTPTETQTATITLTPSVSFTPSETITDTPPPTGTATPRALSAMEQLGMMAAQATVLPRDYAIDGTPVLPGVNIPIIGTPSDLPTVIDFFNDIPGAPDLAGLLAGATGGGAFTSAETCDNPAPGGFGTLETEDFTVRALLGCPQNVPALPITTASAYQPFERGFMLWLESAGSIYVGSDTGMYRVYPDTWDANVDPESGNLTPPDASLSEPIRGFGKVWRDNPEARNSLGWATGAEQGDTATFVQYQQGMLLYAPQRDQIIAFGSSGGWRFYDGSF